MGFKILLLVFLIASYHFQYGDGLEILTIKDFLSDSSHHTNLDHTQALQNAWKALCAGKGRSIVISARETYTIQPQSFLGPCVSRNPHIQIDGTLEAPRLVKDWGAKKSEYWLSFERVNGLVITGSGRLNAHGESWWTSVAFSSRPLAVRFLGCQNLVYDGLTHINSPKHHIDITGCTIATLSHIHIIAPENSPNTDGINIDGSRNIHILSSTIQTGDDCIAITSGSSDINITSVACGPGHGISIGSLGKGGANDVVQNVNVLHSSFKGTQNCARIKTWPGGKGFAKNILYDDITLTDVKFPINIDQHYSDQSGYKPLQGGKAVKVSGVTFRSFRGTCAGGVAINLDCDRIGCDNIVLEHINITPSSPSKPLTTFCKFAHVIARFLSLKLNCGFRADDRLPHAPQAQPPLFFPFHL